MDLAYPPRRLRSAGNTLLILGFLFVCAGVALYVFGNRNDEGVPFLLAVLTELVGTVLLAMGGCLRLMARLGSR